MSIDVIIVYHENFKGIILIKSLIKLIPLEIKISMLKKKFKFLILNFIVFVQLFNNVK